ncbi:uncharacterized protein LOC117600134 [Osmia lignaria lignaria]|uniref:uncharacterized protein LOC117600134 n=1 Tax=Osmia lignaria lignaria TaxID=1437193 RepID=UPI00402B9583
MINYRLRWALETNDIISPHQNGFRPLYSTLDPLINIETDINNGFRNKQHTTLVAMDFEKAYDMICRKRVINILKDLNIHGNILKFIDNFLKTRRIRVRNNTLSKTLTTENGVPQGSVLSVTLFLISINGVLSVVKNPIKVYLFADDLTILYSGKNPKIIQYILQNVLNKLQNWATESGFKFSESKTKYINFSRKQEPLKMKLYLKNTELEQLNHIKILGMIWDSKLTWYHHVTHLRNECTQRLNLLKIIAANNWGADLKILINTYRSIIRAKIDYGSIIYGSANKTILKKLHPVHNTALRITTGAFRTSPTSSILQEANEPSLRHRRKLLSMNQAIKIATTPNKLTYPIILANYNTNRHTPQRNTMNPFHVRVTQTATELNLKFKNITPRKPPTTPPWKIKPIETDTSLTLYLKTNTSPETYRQLAAEIIEKHKDSTHIYTDGSKSSTGTRYAIITPNYSMKTKLPNEASIFSAELMAIKQALQTAYTESYQKTAIFTDSTSAIAAINNTSSYNDTIQQIIETHQKIISNANKIQIIWIPSHVGITGNEKVDQAAREAVDASQTVYNKLCLDEALKMTKKKLRSQWETEWKTTASTRSLNINKKFFKTHTTHTEQPRREQVAISRIRIGHTKTTHSYLLTKDPVPRCEECHAQLTIDHLILNCPKYDTIRRKYTLKSLIKDNLEDKISHDLLKFLKETELLDKIL